MKYIRLGFLPATVLAAILLFSGVLVFPAQSMPLEKAVCKKLVSQHKAYLAEGIADQLVKGHEWAKANLNEQELDKIRRFLTNEEQILFRCPQKIKKIVRNVITFEIPKELQTKPAKKPKPIQKTTRTKKSKNVSNKVDDKDKAQPKIKPASKKPVAKKAQTPVTEKKPAKPKAKETTKTSDTTKSPEPEKKSTKTSSAKIESSAPIKANLSAIGKPKTEKQTTSGQKPTEKLNKAKVEKNPVPSSGNVSDPKAQSDKVKKNAALDQITTTETETKPVVVKKKKKRTRKREVSPNSTFYSMD